jgi:hypothetical protein
MILSADKGFTVIDVNGLILENIQLQTKSKTAFEMLSVGNVVFKNVSYNSNDKSAITVNGKTSSKISLGSVNNRKNQTVIGSEVPADAVIF